MFKEGELHMQQYPVRTIDLEALRENVRLLRSTLPEKTKLMAVVKADAYGHGIAKVARAALEAGASALAVARTDEGAALRQAGVTAPVLVLGASSDEEIAEGVRNELTLTVCTPEMVDTLESCAKDSGLTGLMHLKIDTGMGAHWRAHGRGNPRDSRPSASQPACPTDGGIHALCGCRWQRYGIYADAV